MTPMLRSLWIAISDLLSGWHQTKLFFEHVVTIGHDTLHVLVGTLFWLLFALLLRRPITAWRPWLWTLAVIAFNETADLWNEQWPDPGHQYGEGAKDLLLTMFVPTLMMVAARTRPDLFRAVPRRRRVIPPKREVGEAPPPP